MSEVEKVVASSQMSGKLLNCCFAPRFYNILNGREGQSHSAARSLRHLQLHLLNTEAPATQLLTALLEASGVHSNAVTLHRRVIVQAINIQFEDIAADKQQEVSCATHHQNYISSFFGKNVLTRGVALDFPAATAEEIAQKRRPIMFNLTTAQFVANGFKAVGTYEKDMEEAKIPFEKLTFGVHMEKHALTDIAGALAYFQGQKFKEVQKTNPTLFTTSTFWDILFNVSIPKKDYNESLFLSGILEQAVFHRSFDDEKVVLTLSILSLALLHNLFSEARSLPIFTVDAASTDEALILHSSVKEAQKALEAMRLEAEAALSADAKTEVGEASSLGAKSGTATALPTVSESQMEFKREDLVNYLQESQGLSAADAIALAEESQ